MTLEDSLKVERKEWLAEGRAEGRAEGKAEGRAEGRFEAVDRIISSGLADETKACEVLGVELNDYQEYIANKN